MTDEPDITDLSGIEIRRTETSGEVYQTDYNGGNVITLLPQGSAGNKRTVSVDALLHDLKHGKYYVSDGTATMMEALREASNA